MRCTGEIWLFVQYWVYVIVWSINTTSEWLFCRHCPLTGCNFEFLNHSANSTFFCCIALNEWDHLVFPRRSSPWAPSQLVKSKVTWDLPVWILYLVQSGFMIFFMFISEITKPDEKLNTKSQFFKVSIMLQRLYQRFTSEGLKEVGFQ